MKIDTEICLKVQIIHYWISFTIINHSQYSKIFQIQFKNFQIYLCLLTFVDWSPSKNWYVWYNYIHSMNVFQFWCRSFFFMYNHVHRNTCFWMQNYWKKRFGKEKLNQYVVYIFHFNNLNVLRNHAKWSFFYQCFWYWNWFQNSVLESL